MLNFISIFSSLQYVRIILLMSRTTSQGIIALAFILFSKVGLGLDDEFVSGCGFHGLHAKHPPRRLSWIFKGFLWPLFIGLQCGYLTLLYRMFLNLSFLLLCNCLLCGSFVMKFKVSASTFN